MTGSLRHVRGRDCARHARARRFPTESSWKVRKRPSR
jgi:hypothetical protein